MKLVKRRPEHLRRTKAVKQNKNCLPIDVDLDVATISNRWAVEPERNLLQMDIQDLRSENGISLLYIVH